MSSLPTDAGVPAASPSRFERVTADDIAPGELRGVVLKNGRKLCVGNAHGALFAVCDECPHAGYSLSEGELEGTTLRCIWHGATFSLPSGVAVGGPVHEALKLYEVRATAGGVWIRIEDEVTL